MIIIFASRKGGSGKSTLCCNLAGQLATKGFSVQIIDTDPQGSASKWIDARLENPSAPFIHFTHTPPGRKLVAAMMNEKARPKHDFVLVDLQGVDSEDNRYTLEPADKVVVPFKPSQPDLDTLEWIKKLQDDLQVIRPNVEFFYVLNEAPTTTGREKKESRDYFAALDVPLLDTVIHSRKVYRDSMAVGLSVSEMHDDKAKAEIDQLEDDIFGSQATPPVVQKKDKRTRTPDNVSQL